MSIDPSIIRHTVDSWLIVFLMIWCLFLLIFISSAHLYTRAGVFTFMVYMYILYIYMIIYYMVLWYYVYMDITFYCYMFETLLNYSIFCWGWWAAQHFATSPVWRETYPQFPRPWYAPGLKLANFFSLPRGIDYRKSMLFRYIAL